MSFLSNIIQRHTGPINLVKPRLKGIFEQESSAGPTVGDVFSEPQHQPDPPADFPPNENAALPSANITPGRKHEVSVENKNTAASSLTTSNSEEGNYKIQIPAFTAAAGNQNNFIRNNNALQIVANSSDNQPSDKSLGINGKTEVQQLPARPKVPFHQELDNEGPHPIAVQNNTALASASANVITVSSNIMRKEEEASSETLNHPMNIQQNKTVKTLETLNWVRNIKNTFTPEAAEKGQPATPVIKVTIGRIDVRATGQPAAARVKADPRPLMTLDDFLKKKNGSA